MPIYQVNLWICERCGEKQSTSRKVFPYEHTPANPPEEGWKMLDSNIDENEPLACPRCSWDMNAGTAKKEAP